MLIYYKDTSIYRLINANDYFMAKRPVFFILRIIVLLFVCVFLKSTVAHALPPPGQGLEAQAERFRQEYSLERQVRDKKRAKPSIEFKEKEQKPVTPGPSFQLKAIKLTGTTILEPARFKFIWEPFIGKKVNFTDINGIVTQIKRLYVELGYLTTTVYLPQQDIKNGEVEIRVLEGKRGNLTVEGNKWHSTPSITKYMHAFRGEVLDMVELQKDVMRLNDHQDLNVSSVLAPGEDPGTIDVTLKAKDSFPYHAATTVDNQGTRLTGRYRESFVFNTSNLTGNYDSFIVNTTHTAFSSGEYVSYAAPWGTHGTKVGMEVGYFQAKLGQEYLDADVTTRATFYNPNISWELYQSPEAQVDLRSGIRIKDIKKKEGLSTITDESLRLPYVGLDVVRMDSMGQTTFSPDVTFGTKNFMGATSKNNPDASREKTGGAFVKYCQTFSRYQRMPWESYMQIRSQLQIASQTLPTTEQIQLGGANSVRGYPEGDYLADTGGSVSVDWFFPLYFIPPNWQFKYSSTNVRHQVEPLIFFDVGRGKLKRTLRGELRDKYLAGVGTGVKVHFNNNMFLLLEWAKPLGDDPIKGTGPSTFNVSFQAAI